MAFRNVFSSSTWRISSVLYMSFSRRSPFQGGDCVKSLPGRIDLAGLTIFLFCMCTVVTSAFADVCILTGADRLFEDPYISWIEGKRVGLVTNQTGVNRNLKSLPDHSVIQLFNSLFFFAFFIFGITNSL